MYVDNILPKAQSGLGWWWSSEDWYTVWNGSKWLPSKLLDSSDATEWRLNEMEKNWNKAVYLYRYDSNVSSWKSV